VVGAEGDASARLIDIRRLAVEVAREGGPVVPAAGAPAPASPPLQTSASTVARAPEPAVAPAPRAAGKPARPTAAAAPAAVAPRPVARATPRAPVSRPERAAVEPARGAGPSFNCRYARTASEKMVCSDPGLAALDRGLNAAFEDAIAGGADRRSLRLAQDRWLARREAAAPDAGAVADAYRRRIDELRSGR
jgi:uncharacterized protein YecT (DUF1311 family)